MKGPWSNLKIHGRKESINLLLPSCAGWAAFALLVPSRTKMGLLDVAKAPILNDVATGKHNVGTKASTISTPLHAGCTDA